MRFLWTPRSFSGLVLIGFFFVSLPLIAALVHAQFSIDRLARRSTQAIYHSVTVAEGSRVLVQQLVALERKARQYQVLNDAQLLREVTEKHLEVQNSIRNLLSLGPQLEQQELLKQLKAGEQDLFDALLDRARSGEEDKGLFDVFADLSELTKEIYSQGYRLIFREVDAMQRAADHYREMMLWQVAWLVPCTVAFVWFFARLIARPVRQIHAGIGRLGEGDFSAPVRVGGPQDLQNLGQRLDWLRQRLGEVEREKARFVAHVSHELKTPLASIREGSELLTEGVPGPLNEQQHEIARILQKNSLQLQKLIENLLNYSRSQARIMTLPPAHVDLHELVEDVFTDQKSTILKKKLNLQRSVDESVQRIDRERLRTILDNLFSNAVKYTPPGGTIDLILTRQDHDLVLEVSDSGPGISKKERQKIYEPFFQGAAQGSGHVQGTGLGLSIVREYVQAMNGRIELEKSARGGALFRVRLPLISEGGSR